MQGPEIFEQPVADRDPEAHTPADENGTFVYGTGVGTGLADNESEDYHDFVYPEGSSCFLFSLWWGEVGGMFLTRGRDQQTGSWGHGRPRSSSSTAWWAPGYTPPRRVSFTPSTASAPPCSFGCSVVS